MTPSAKTYRIVRLIAILGLLSFASLLFFGIFSVVIQPSPMDGPVEKWIQAGIDLHRVDELDSLKAFSRSEYELEYKRALATAQEVARLSEFPGTDDAYVAYKEQRERVRMWSLTFWVSLAISLAVSLSAYSWLHGAAWGAASRTEKATGIA